VGIGHRFGLELVLVVTPLALVGRFSPDPAQNQVFASNSTRFSQRRNTRLDEEFPEPMQVSPRYSSFILGLLRPFGRLEPIPYVGIPTVIIPIQAAINKETEHAMGLYWWPLPDSYSLLAAIGSFPLITASILLLVVSICFF
jgi:hypothetical protein